MSTITISTLPLTATSTSSSDWFILSQFNGLAYDSKKISPSVISSFVAPLTTKGDILGYSTTNARIPVGTNGQFLVANSSASLGVNWTGSFINNATGFSLAGGNTSKTLTVSSDCTIDQNLSTLSNVKFISETLTTNADTQLFLKDINSINTRDATFKYIDSDQTLYIQAYDHTSNVGQTISLNKNGGQVIVGDSGSFPNLCLLNVFGDISIVKDSPQIAFTDTAGIVSGIVGILFCSDSIGGPVFQGYDYINNIAKNTYVGAFGANVGIGKTGDGNPAADFPVHIHGKTVIGTFDMTWPQLILKDENNPNRTLQLGWNTEANTAWIQAESDFGVPGQLSLQIEDGNVAIGTNAGTPITANAQLHSMHSTIVGLANSAVSDPNLYNSNLNFWLDEINTILNFKAKDSTGTVTTFSITPGGGNLWEQFSNGGNQYLRPIPSLGITAIQSDNGLFGVDPNIYGGTQVANTLLVVNPANAAQQIGISYDSLNDVSSIQSVYQGVDLTPLMLQSAGGNVGIGFANNHSFTSSFEVAGTSKFSDVVFVNNGMLIADANGGIQFNDTGSMTLDTGISFFAGNQYYRIGFDNNSGTTGWLRQNVDAVDNIHGFVWSAGTITGPTNWLMQLNTFGQLWLGSSANSTTSMQSLLNIEGDIYLNNITTPSTPTGGGKLYSKLVSGNSDLYFLDSAGTEHQLTSGSGVGFWNRTGTQLYPTTSGDSLLIPVDATISDPHITLSNISFPNSLVKIWKSTTGGNYTAIQSYTDATPTYDSILLNPNGGKVAVNSGFIAPPSVSFYVDGSSQFDGDLTIDSSTLRVTNGEAIVQKDSTSAQLLVRGSTDVDKSLQICTDTTNNISFLQAYSTGPTPTEIKFNPIGGNVSIGLSVASASPSKLYVGGNLQVQADGTSGSNTPQIRIKGSSNSNKECQVGYDTTNNYSYVQSVEQGVAITPLVAQPAGGKFGITVTDPKANLHSAGMTIIGAHITPNSSSDLSAIGSCNIYRIESLGTYYLAFQVRCGDNVIRSAQITLT